MRKFTRLSVRMLALVFLSAGCQQATSVPSAVVTAEADRASEVGGQKTEVGQAVATFAEPPADNLEGGQLVEEFWDAYSMQGSRIGYARTTIVKLQENGRELLRTTNYIRTEMQRGGQSVAQEILLKSWDTPSGKFVSFESRMSAGPGEIVAVGAVQGNQLGIDVTTLGRTESLKLPWQPEWGGLFAPEQSLRKQPLAAGQSRTVRSLLPIFNVPGETRMVAEAVEPVDLPSGSQKLLKVRSTLEVGPQKIESLLWINERGETIKSLVPGIGQEAVRTTKTDALKRSTGGQYDLLLASTVPLKGTLPNPPATKRAVYKASLKSGQIAGLFASGLPQQIKPLDERTAQITVIAIRPDHPATPSVPQPPPAAADSASNNFIQSDDAQIVALASLVAPDETDPWKLACALEKFVDETIQLKNFSQAFATAAEVCRSLEGDCTEHAVLLAALCRARDIPARVAFGLVYYPPEKGFAYHMWNEVWIRDRWVPLDSTLGLGGIGADHIKLGDSNLAGGSPLADLLAVIQIFGRLELEVVEAE